MKKITLEKNYHHLSDGDCFMCDASAEDKNYIELTEDQYVIWKNFAGHVHTYNYAMFKIRHNMRHAKRDFINFIDSLEREK